MTTPRDPDEILAAWLDEGPTRLPDQTRRAIVVALPTTSRRRHAWSVPWRFPIMPVTFKVAIGALVVVAVAVGGLFFLRQAPGGVGTDPGPSVSPVASPVAGPSASPSPSPSPAAPSPSVAPSPTDCCSSKFGVPIELTLVDGWTVDNTQLGTVDFSGPDKVASIMSIADMTVRGAKPGDPWVSWPADIHAWLGSRAEFKPAAPRSTTIGGRPATVIDVDIVTPLADDSDWVRCGPKETTSCGINLYSANASGANGWRIHLVVVPTGPGTGIVGYIDAPVVASAGAFEDVAASFDRLLSTLEFR